MKIALIVGAGLSVAAGVPSTNQLARRFLATPRGSGPVDDAITEALTAFWNKVFGASDKTQPTLEEHFTVLDLAANTGHQLGRAYPPRKLRAIRRLSIHRTFQVLDRHYRHSRVIEMLLKKVSAADCTVALVSLNWDIVVEKHLDALGAETYKYDIDVRYIDGERIERGPIRLYKMHGSSNWLYCDSCRQLYAPRDGGKAALNLNAYLEPHDFEALGFQKAADLVRRQTRGPRKCAWCGNRLAGRLATFSYRKAFSINQFQTIWDRAYSALARADRWLFIGYSMPEADFESKHLLKAAQLARPKPSELSIDAVVKGDPDAEERYRGYFGKRIGTAARPAWRNGWMLNSMTGFNRDSRDGPNRGHSTEPPQRLESRSAGLGEGASRYRPGSRAREPRDKKAVAEQRRIRVSY